MNELKLNETPIRTSRNFNINNIKLKDIILPEDIREFRGQKIKQVGKNINLEYDKLNSNFKYGVGDILIDEIENRANKSLRITVNGTEKQIIEIENNFDKDNINLIENLEIIVNEGACLDILLKYNSESKNANYHNGAIKVFAKSRAKANIILINFLNEEANNFISIENNLEEGAEANYVFVDFGGKNSIINYYAGLNR